MASTAVPTTTIEFPAKAGIHGHQSLRRGDSLVGAAVKAFNLACIDTRGSLWEKKLVAQQPRALPLLLSGRAKSSGYMGRWLKQVVFASSHMGVLRLNVEVAQSLIVYEQGAADKIMRSVAGIVEVYLLSENNKNSCETVFLHLESPMLFNFLAVCYGIF